MTTSVTATDNKDKIMYSSYNSLFFAKYWQNPASIDGEKQNKNCS